MNGTNKLFPRELSEGMPSRMRESGDLNTPPPEDFDTEAMQGSMQQILSENLGEFVVCEFVIGTQAMTRKEGILYSVGRSFIALYEEINMTYVVCDIFSIKFVTFYLPGRRPRTMPRAAAPMSALPR